MTRTDEEVLEPPQLPYLRWDRPHDLVVVHDDVPQVHQLGQTRGQRALQRLGEGRTYGCARELDARDVAAKVALHSGPPPQAWVSSARRGAEGAQGVDERRPVPGDDGLLWGARLVARRHRDGVDALGTGLPPVIPALARILGHAHTAERAVLAARPREAGDRVPRIRCGGPLVANIVVGVPHAAVVAVEGNVAPAHPGDALASHLSELAVLLLELVRALVEAGEDAPAEAGKGVERGGGGGEEEEDAEEEE